MSSSRDVDKLLGKLNSNVGAGPAEGPNKLAHYLLPEIDVSPFIKARAWPGKTFVLLGNSFNVEQKIAEPNAQNKRSATLAMMFERAKDTHSCVHLIDAMQNASFLEVLSRFERDWLQRMASDTVLGPAYNSEGKLEAQAFAVWRAHTAPMKKRKKKELATAAR